MWNKYHENLLKKWAQMCKTYSIMHTLSAARYSAWDRRLGIPVVILGAATSTLIFGSSSDTTGVMRYINGTLALIVTALAGVSRFINTGEKTVKHKAVSFKYTSIAMNIDTILSFPRSERAESPQEFISSIKSNILEVRENAPEVLMSIMNNYLRKYDKTLTNVKSNVNTRESVYDSDGPTAYSSGSSKNSSKELDKLSPNPNHVLTDFGDNLSKIMVTAGDRLKLPETDGNLTESDWEDNDIEDDYKSIESTHSNV